MGVRLLQMYIERYVKNGVYEIDIQKEIENYKRAHNGEEPLILIDLLSIHQIFYTNNHELMLGGRYNLYNERTTNFFRKIKSLGVELVFFTDGPARPEKIATCLKRRNQTYRKANTALQVVYSGSDLSEKLNEFEVESPVPFFASLKKIASTFGEVHKSMLNECDIELADYAIEHNALAIISNDTDFLIFEGNWRYWSSKRVDIITLKTVEFNREALRQNLNLRSDQMALLATMCGNDIIPFDSIRGFHRKIQEGSTPVASSNPFFRNKYSRQNQDGGLHFRAVADEIRSLRLNPKYISNWQARFISRQIFDKIDDKLNEDLVKLSLKSYDYSQLNRKHDSELLTSQIKGKFNCILLANIEYIVQLHHFDLSKNDLTPFFNLISPLICRIMGIILNNESKPITRIFYSKLSHHKEYEKIVLEAEYPPYEIPPLKHLLLCEAGEDLPLDQKRLELICWLISPKLTPDIIKNLPEDNVAYCITLLYLVELKQINVDEADCLLLACNCPRDIQESLNLSDMKNINERDCRIAFLFTASQRHIKNCFFAVGWRKFSNLITFDGLYFHHLRQKWNASFSASILSDFEVLRIYAN